MNTSSIEIKPFAPEDEAVWDSFVDNSINGTIFHTRNFLNYHPPDRFSDRSLLFYKKGRLCALFPAGLVYVGEKKIFKSHPGSSYGGLVVQDPPGIQDALSMVEALVDYASDEGCHEIGLRIAPKIYNT